jgi:hypothetical protein
VDAIRADIPRTYTEAVAWACRNGEHKGAWIAIALRQADTFFVGPEQLYGGWCSDEIGQVAEHMRLSLVSVANQRVFGKVE